jgi:hypothetical protein
MVNDPAQRVSDGGERAGTNLVVRFHHPPLDYTKIRTRLGGSRVVERRGKDKDSKI